MVSAGLRPFQYAALSAVSTGFALSVVGKTRFTESEAYRPLKTSAASVLTTNPLVTNFTIPLRIGP